MRGLGTVLLLLAGLVAAASGVVALGCASALGGRIVLVTIAVIAVWPLACLAWAGVMEIRFSRARGRCSARLAQEIDRSGRAGERVVLVMLRFPEVRSLDFPFLPSHGDPLHGLRSRFRSYDQVERVGFASYVMILPGTDSLGVLALRERLHDAIRREHRWRIRLGMSVHPEDGLTPDILLDHAERHCA